MKKREDRLKSSNRYLLMIVAAIIILLLMGIEYFIQVTNNREQSYRTAEVLISQVKSVLENNEQKEHILTDSLKEDYVTRAKAVSYILDRNLWIENDVEELQRVAELISVDEIHIFNETGEIYSGTVPKYFGYSFDSGEQMAYFKPMLTDRTLSMCQDVTPNTAEAKEMMYAICWNDSGNRMTQVGIEPLRLIEELRSNEVSEVIHNMPSYDGINIVVADRDTWEILADSANSDDYSLVPVGRIDESDLTGVAIFDVIVNGEVAYCSASTYEDYIIAIVQDRAVINKNIPLSMGISFAYLLLAAMILYFVFSKLTEHILEEQRNANTDPMTGLFNRRAYEMVLEEYHKNPPGDRFICVSMDLNGLKAANDTFGHDEGDRLIKCAANCMMRCFGNYGRVFRIGGDEFVALIFDDAVHLEKVKTDFIRTLDEESEKNNMELSVSCGYVTREEFPVSTIEEIAMIADERMYQAKSVYHNGR